MQEPAKNPSISPTESELFREPPSQFIPRMSATLEQAVHMVVWDNRDGDIIEFGVGAGHSLAAMYDAYHSKVAEYAKRWASSIDSTKQSLDPHSLVENPARMVAVDSFEGLPPQDNFADRPPAHWINPDTLSTEGRFQCSRDRFEYLLKEHGIGEDELVVVGHRSGKIPLNVLGETDVLKAALIHFDLDLYQPTLDALKAVRSALKPGTILVFDEWNYHKADPKLGVQGAVNRWLADNPKSGLNPLNLSDPGNPWPAAFSYFSKA